MTIREYQLKAARTMNPKLSVEQTIRHALDGMAAEDGEVHSIFQKVLQGSTFDAEHLKKEIGDLLWMIAELTTAYGIDLDEVATMKITKLEARYPDGFDEERHLHRAEGDI